MEYVDVLFTHHVTTGKESFLQTWKRMEQQQLQGKVRFLGVNSFQELKWVQACIGEGFCLKQDRLFYQIPCTLCGSSLHDELWLTRRIESFRLLGNVVLISNNLARCQGEPVVSAIARHRGTSFHLIVLQWMRQMGIISLFSSTNVSHVQANLQTHISLSLEEMAVLLGLENIYSHSLHDSKSNLDNSCPRIKLDNLLYDPLGMRPLFTNLTEFAGSNCAMGIESPNEWRKMKLLWALNEQTEKTQKTQEATKRRRKGTPKKAQRQKVNTNRAPRDESQWEL